jgi:hypothetical protein
MRVVSARGTLGLALRIASGFATHVHADENGLAVPVWCPGHFTGRVFATRDATARPLDERHTRPACR